MNKLLQILFIGGWFLTSAIEVNAQCNITTNPSGSVNICSGQSVVLTANGASTYSWSPAGGLSGTTGATVTATPFVTITYRVIGTCPGPPVTTKDTAYITVNVSPTPTAAFTYTPATAQCGNLPVQFNGSGTGTGLTYAWNFGDPTSSSNTSTSQNPTHTFNTAIGNGTQSFIVTLVVTNSAGCSATVIHNVTVNQIPSAAMGGTGFVVINGQPYFKTCTSNPTSTFTFTNTSTTTATNTNYTINWGDGSPNFTSATAWGPTMTHTYAIGIYTLAYTVTGANGCSNTINYSVFVGSNPAVGIGNPGNSTICGPNTLTFPITGTSNNPPGTMYTVTFNDGSAPITFPHPPPASVAHLFSISSCGTTSSNGTTSYPNSFSASITASNPCGTSSGAVVPIYVSAPPVASFTISPSTTICVNTSATFSNTTVGFDINPVTGVCNQTSQPVVWSITPAAGWTTGGSLGNTFNLTDPNLWLAGSNALNVNFNTIGSYTITMVTGSTNQCGLDTISQTICVVPPPTPAFSMSPPNGCAPSTVTISNTSLGSAGCSTLGYSWVVSYSSGCIYYSSGSYIYSSGNSTATNPVFTFSTPGSYNITLNVSNACGTFAASQTTVVKTVPYITTNTPVSGACGTNTVNPANYFNVYGCGGTVSNYAWTYAGGNPATGTGASPGNVTFTAGGTNTISLIATNECGSTPSSVYVPVYPLPIVNAGPSFTICQGFGSPLNGSASNGTPSYWYSWSPSGNVNSPSSANTTAYPNSTTTYTLSVTDWYGCSGSDTMIVTVKPTPTVTVVAQPSTVCYGNTVMLIATGANTYSWSGSGLIGVSSNDTVYAVPTISGNFSVTGTNLFNCSDNDAVYVTVNPLPNLSVWPSNNNTICLGSSITLTANGASTYTWHPAGTLNTSTGATVTATPAATTTYHIVGTSVFGCIDSTTAIINVNGVPTVTASAALPLTCPGAPNTLTAGGATTYTWSPATALSSTTGQVVVASPTVTTTYVVTGTNGANCTDTAFVVCVVKPIQTLSFSHFDSTICLGQTIDTITVSGGSGYIWSPALGLNTTTGPTVVATPTVTTKYYCTATNTVGCSITDSTYVTVDTLPKADAGANKVICMGTSTVIGVAPIAGFSYVWTPTTALTNPNVANPTASPTTNTTYIVTRTNNITGCYKSDTMTVTVVPLPPAPSVSSNSPVCWYSNINLTANGLPGSTYTWTGPGAYSSTSQNPVIVNALYPDTGMYYCSQFIGGCNSPTDSVFVHMFPKPAALSGVNQTICSNQSAAIGGLQVPGSTYFWYSNPLGYANTNPSDTVTPLVTTTYTIVETDIHNCQDSNNVVITVKPLPVVSFTHPNPACINAGVLFTNNSFSSIILNHWGFGDGGWSGITSPNHAYANPGSYMIELICTTTDGCIDSITDSITVVTVATPSYTLSPDSGCGPLAVSFVNNSFGYNPTYNWDLGYNSQTYVGTVPPTTSYPEPFKGDTTYYIILQAVNLCGAVSYTDSVVVHPSPHAQFGTNVSSGCSPLPIYFSNVSIGLPTTFLWNFGDGSATTTAMNPPPHTYFTGTQDTTYYITLIVSNACGADTLVDSILVHPNTVNAFFNIAPTAGCAPFTTTVQNFSTGATSISWNFGNGNYSSQQVVSQTYPNAGTYTISLYANNGCSYDTTSTTITVYPLPNVIATPASQGICSGSSTNIALNSLAPGTNFTWTVVQNGVTGASGGMGNSINQVLSLTGSTPGTAIYTITPTPTIYGCIGSPITDTVTVSLSPTVTVAPTSQTICEGTSPTINLSGSIPGTTFSWIVLQNNTTGGTNAIGSVINQTLFCATPTTGTATYQITPNYNGCLGPMDSAVITVNPVPTAVATPSSASICTGATPVINLTSSVIGASFSWTVVQSGVSGASNGTGSIISQTLTTTGTVSGTATYTITPTANGCTGIPIQVTIIVNPIPSVNATPPNQTICSGAAPAINLTSNVIATSFAWTVSPFNVAGASNSSGAVISQTLTTTGTTSGTVDYTITPSVGACAGTPILVTITVNPTPTAIAAPVTQTICSGDSSNLSLTSNVTGTTYAWTVAQNGVTGATAGNGSLINEQLNSTGTTIGTVNYTITPTANLCPGAPIIIPVTVNPIPVATATPSTQTICSGTAINIPLSGSVSGTTFTWTLAQSGVGGAAGGSGAIIAQTLNALGSTIDSANYLVTPLANGCPGLPIGVTAIVNPIPVATATPPAQTICSGTNTNISLTGSVSGTQFSWTVVQSGVVGATNGSGFVINQTLVTTGPAVGTVTYTITPVANACNGLPINVTITVNPGPNLSMIISDDTVCVGVPVTFSFVYPGLSSFQWKFGDGATDIQNPSVHQYAASGNYTVRLIGTTVAFGCTDSAQQVVTILPTPILNVVTTPAFGCKDLGVQITNNTQFANFHNWDLGDGNSSNSSASVFNHTYTMPGTHTIIYIATNANTCADTGYYQIVVYPKPVAAFSYIASNPCQTPFSLTLSNSSNGANSFVWDDGLGNTNLNTNTIITYNQPGNHVVTLIAFNANGCSDTSSQTVISYPAPHADFSGTPQVGCEPLEVTFSDLSTDDFYQHWVFGDGTFADNTKTPTHQFVAPGIYNVSLKIEGLNHVCSDSILKPGYITVLPRPIAAFTYDDLNSPAPNVEVRFTSQSTNAVNYVWDFGDVSNPLTTPDSVSMHSYLQAGNYRVVLIAIHANGCTDTTSKLIETEYISGLYVPNAMSPHAGLNEEVKVFMPKGVGLISYKAQVFTTWGEKLWESVALDEKGSPTESWDGTYKGELMPQDVYVWKIEGQFSNQTTWQGNSYDGKKFSRTGTLTLLR